MHRPLEICLDMVMYSRCRFGNKLKIVGQNHSCCKLSEIARGMKLAHCFYGKDSLQEVSLSQIKLLARESLLMGSVRIINQ